LFDKSLVSGDMMGEHWPEKIKWLQNEGYLSQIQHKDLNLGEIEVLDAEAQSIEKDPNLTTGLDLLNERLGKDSKRNTKIADHILAMDPEWPVVVFAGSVLHAQLLAAELSELGAPARPIWGELAGWARTDAIEKFRSGEIRVLTNYGVLTEGFDAPKTRAVVIARFVQSDGLFIQMLGRGLRGPKNRGTEHCTLVTMGESLPTRFNSDGRLDVNRFDYLWH
jgi:superfamily II DNA or RNA helicase